MIPIIFYAGTHGNFTEFVLNKILHGDQIYRTNPLGVLGTSHAQLDDANYLSHKTFVCYHPEHFDFILSQPFIKINFDSSEDLFVIQLSLKRGADHGIDLDHLEHMTYQKLFEKYGYYGKGFPGPNNIIDDINKFTDLTPYYNIKDDAWPRINSVEDFYNLPTHILEECANVFGYKPICISESRPDAPRWVLRSIFKSWFYDQSTLPSTKMSLIEEHGTCYNLQLRNLYDVDKFKQEIISIGKFFNLDMNLDNFSHQVHQRFVDMIPYKESKHKCQRIINSIHSHENYQISLNVLEEGYVNYCLEKKLGITMPEEVEQYFKDTGELSNYVNQKLSALCNIKSPV